MARRENRATLDAIVRRVGKVNHSKRTARPETPGRSHRHVGDGREDSDGRNRGQPEIRPHSFRQGGTKAHAQKLTSEDVARSRARPRTRGGVTMSNIANKSKEIDKIWSFFLGKLPELKKRHAGKSALIRSQSIEGFFDTIGDAQLAEIEAVFRW